MRRHPSGFLPLCFAVLCERCAAYVLASSVVFMLCQRYGLSRDEALRLAGRLTAASYAGTVLGGIVADRVLGHRRALGASLLLLMLGYAALSLQSSTVLGLAAVLLIVGNSLFKPSSQAVLSGLYVQDESRLDAAQIWFHLAVNVGAVLGALLAGFTTRGCGWSTLFTIAAAMVLIGRVGLFAVLRNVPSSPGSSRVTKATPTERLSLGRRAKTIAALTLGMLLFTVGYGQVDGTLLLWAQHRTDRFLLGFEVPAAWFVGFPAALVLLLAPVQLALLPRLQRRIGAQRLVAWGLIAAALAFAVLLPVAFDPASQPASMLWILGSLTLLVVAELLVAPLGVAEVMRLAPPRFVAAVVGVWHIASAVGYWLAGELGALWVNGSPVGGLGVLVALLLLGSLCSWGSRPRQCPGQPGRRPGAPWASGLKLPGRRPPRRPAAVPRDPAGVPREPTGVSRRPTGVS